MIPKGLLYTKDHEWAKIEGDIAIVGITDHAQNQLGELTFVELPDVGKKVAKGGEAAVVESVKAASEVFAPVGGEVVAVEHRPGSFHSADLPAASADNERNSVVIRTPQGHEVVVVQIAGLIARRIVCDVREQIQL